MLELFIFGPYFGLPDASPFCIKGLTLMKMSGLPFEVKKMSFRQAPKGKAPYLKDGEKIIADSHFIMRHLEDKYGINFNGNYVAADLAKAWAVARMMEEHFYFITGHIRWLRDENFWKGPYQFFEDAPKPIRPLIARIVRRGVKKTQHGQGIGRHTDAERFELAKGDLQAVENLLGENLYLLGATLCAADASVYGAIASAECPYFKSEVGDYIRSRPRLMAYLQRLQTQYFPDYKTTS